MENQEAKKTEVYNRLPEVISEATAEIFATMIFMDIAPKEPLLDKTDRMESNVTSMIGLAGDLRGILAIHCPGEVARAITGAMLGMDIEKLNEDVKDAIGEIANMVAGGLKIALGEEERDLELAIPTTAFGKSIRLSGIVGAQRFIMPFTTDKGDFGIELKYVLA